MCAPSVIAMEMHPGPTVIGKVRGVEGVVHGIFEGFSGLFCLWCAVLLIEQGPASRSHYQSARNLDYHDADAEEIEDDAAEQEGTGQQCESVGSDLACQNALCRPRVALRQRQEDRRVAESD